MSARQVRVPAISSQEVDEAISRLPWVLAARVVASAGGVVKEVHVLAGPGANPALLSRQVETLLRSKWGLVVDRRKVSIACLSRGTGERPRVRLAAVEAMDGRVRVKVEKPRLAGQEAPVSYCGVADAAGSGAGEVALAAAAATCAALCQLLPTAWELNVEGAAVAEVGGRETAVALVSLARPGLPREKLAGAALVRGDGAAWAGARACLDAVNRVFQAIPGTS